MAVSAPPPLPGKIRAVVQDRYGGPDVLRVGMVDLPVPDETSVLVRVRAASINALDYRTMGGIPLPARVLLGIGVRRPKQRVRGVDVAGRVETVGAKVTGFRVGDEVFGLGSGSFAEYVAADQVELDHKPEKLSYEQAAALPIAGVTALQALRDRGKVAPGTTVLINGAGGGVGTFAVQIARAFGARVTAVTSTKNVDLVRSLGAEAVIDYVREDITRRPERYDVLLDILGDRSFSSLRRLLNPGGRLVVVGGRGLSRFLKAALVRRFLRYPMEFFIAQVRTPELATLRGMADSGKIAPVIERECSLDEVPAAMAYAASHQVRGKLVVRLS